MSLTLYNTRTRKKEPFIPLHEGEVRMYNCGPTVYDYAHIGNFSAYLMADLLRRYLEYRGFKVLQVKNITDVGHMTSDADEGEDKMEKAARREQKDPWQIARYYEKAYQEDELKLHILPPHVAPRATEHIPEMIAMIETLIKKGNAYLSSDGVYFDISTFPHYGMLSGNRLEELTAGARVTVNENKRHPHDFALWKLNQPKHLMQWESPWGRGFPGWHIECSAMSRKYLGDQLDIHTGGEDNIFPHHECEVAQSESCNGQPFVRYWLHKRHLMVEGLKMSKSLGNFYTLRDLIEKGYSPLAFRYLVLASHYRSKLDFSEAALTSSQKAIDRINEFLWRVGELPKKDRESTTVLTTMIESTETAFQKAMDDDLNTPTALKELFGFIHEVNTLIDQDTVGQTGGHLVVQFFERMNMIFDVWQLERPRDFGADEDQIKALIGERNAARERKDFATADQVRQTLLKMGVVLEDTSDGTKYFRKSV